MPTEHSYRHRSRRLVVELRQTADAWLQWVTWCIGTNTDCKVLDTQTIPGVSRKGRRKTRNRAGLPIAGEEYPRNVECYLPPYAVAEFVRHCRAGTLPGAATDPDGKNIARWGFRPCVVYQNQKPNG